MGEFTSAQRISKIFGLITSSTFFVSLFVIIALTIAVVIINNKINSKVPKILIGIGYLVIVVFVILRYGTAIYNVQDSFTDKIFSSFYFPNLITYICILLISLFVIIIDFLDKNKTIIFKVISIISFGTIMSLFVITLDVINKNEIEVYSASSIYSNDNLMILIQATTSIFAIWIIIELIDYFSRKISNNTNQSVNKVPNSNMNSMSRIAISNGVNVNSSNKNNNSSSINMKNKGMNDYSNYRKDSYLNNYVNISNGYDKYYGIKSNISNKSDVPDYLNESLSLKSKFNKDVNLMDDKYDIFNNNYDSVNNSYDLYTNNDAYKSVNYLGDSFDKTERDFNDYFNK